MTTELTTEEKIACEKEYRLTDEERSMYIEFENFAKANPLNMTADEADAYYDKVNDEYKDFWLMLVWLKKASAHIAINPETNEVLQDAIAYCLRVCKKYESRINRLRDREHWRVILQRNPTLTFKK